MPIESTGLGSNSAPKDVKFDSTQWAALLAILSATGGSGGGGNGSPGAPGAPGESAYQIAKRLDPTIGTEAEWITALEDDDDHRWVSGIGAPTQAGEPGTFYLDTSTGRVYESVEE